MNRCLRVTQASLAWIALGTLAVGSLGHGVYMKDLQADYLAASALRNGVDVFTPLSVLSKRYFPIMTTIFPHPNPHPPVLALLALPLTLLPFPMTVFLWLTLNVCLLVIIGTWLGLSVQRSLALAAWPPLWIHLNAGNLELVILTLAMLGWRAAAVGRDLRAGVWLGLAAAIKLYPVLLLVPFVARRRWRLVVAAGTILVLSQLGDLAVVGPSGFVRYYTEILPTVSGFYSHVQVNNSPYGALLRLFGDASDVAPLIHDPGVVVPLTVAISLFALVALAKMEPEAAPVAILVALPTVWCTYAVLALPQMVKLLRWRIWRPAVLLACAAASVVYPLVDLLVQWSGSHALPMAALLAVQPFGFLGLLGLSVASACPVGRAARLACLSSLV